MPWLKNATLCFKNAAFTGVLQFLVDITRAIGEKYAKSITTLKKCREKWINAFLLQQKAAKLAAAGLDIRDSIANLLDEGDADLLF